MLSHQQEHYSWHFTFLGANQDAFAEAGALGINAAGVGQAVIPPTCKSLTGSPDASFRGCGLSRSSAETVHIQFTDEEREKMS